MKRGGMAFQGTSELGSNLAVALRALPSGEAVSEMRRDVAGTAARSIVTALFTVMAVRLGLDYAQSGKLPGLLLLASGALVVVLPVARRSPASVDRSHRARVLTVLSMLGPPLV